MVRWLLVALLLVATVPFAPLATGHALGHTTPLPQHAVAAADAQPCHDHPSSVAEKDRADAYGGDGLQAQIECERMCAIVAVLADAGSDLVPAVPLHLAAMPTDRLSRLSDELLRPPRIGAAA